MAFKNPVNISSLDDETCAKVALHGTYYSDARTRYPDLAAVVRCDKCGLCPLACSIGFESYDLCLPCVNTIRSNTLTVQDLEADLTTRTAALHVEGHNTEATQKQGDKNLEYIMSNIQCGTARILYNYLNKIANRDSKILKLTADESQKLSEYCICFLNATTFIKANTA